MAVIAWSALPESCGPLRVLLVRWASPEQSNRAESREPAGRQAARQPLLPAPGSTDAGAGAARVAVQ